MSTESSSLHVPSDLLEATLAALRGGSSISLPIEVKEDYRWAICVLSDKSRTPHWIVRRRAERILKEWERTVAKRERDGKRKEATKRKHKKRKQYKSQAKGYARRYPLAAKWNDFRHNWIRVYGQGDNFKIVRSEFEAIGNWANENYGKYWFLKKVDPELPLMWKNLYVCKGFKGKPSCVQRVADVVEHPFDPCV